MFAFDFLNPYSMTSPPKVVTLRLANSRLVVRAREAGRKGGRASGDGDGGGGGIDDDEADAGDNTQHSRIE